MDLLPSGIRMHAVESAYDKLLRFVKEKSQDNAFHGSICLEVRINAGRVDLVRVGSDETIKPVRDDRTSLKSRKERI